MTVNVPAFGPAELGCKVINMMQFYGCCGVTTWYLGPASNNSFIKSDLKIMADKENPRKAIALVIITEDQRTSGQEAVLLEFGFKLIWGPIPNPNTHRNLYGYLLNLNDYRAKTAVKATPATFTPYVPPNTYIRMS